MNMSKIKALYKVLEDKKIQKKLNNYQNTKQLINRNNTIFKMMSFVKA